MVKQEIDKEVGFEGSVKNLDSEGAFQKAKKLGLHVWTPRAGELFLDIDNKAAYEHYQFMTLIAQRESLREFITIRDIQEFKSRSGDKYNKHVVIETGNGAIMGFERLLLQACFGSDRQKEFFSYIRMLMNDPCPTLLFQTRHRRSR